MRSRTRRHSKRGNRVEPSGNDPTASREGVWEREFRGRQARGSRGRGGGGQRSLRGRSPAFGLRMRAQILPLKRKFAGGH